MDKQEPTTCDTADVILLACILAIVFVTAFWTCKLCCKPQVQPIKIEVIASDSLCTKNYLAKEQVDSLITAIKHQESQLSDKYQYVLEQKMNQDQYFSLGTFLVGVVLSVFGFFGYKSIKSIEEKANKDAERAAKQTSEDVTREYLNEKLDGKVTLAADRIFNSQGAEIMRNKIQDETLRHDEAYINSLLEQLRADLHEYIEGKMSNQKTSTDERQSESSALEDVSSQSDSDVPNMF